MEKILYNGRKEDYQDLIDNGYEFKLGEYINQGWNIAKQNVGGFVGFSLFMPIIILVFYLIIVAIFAGIFMTGSSNTGFSPSLMMIVVASIIGIVAYIALFVGLYTLSYGYFCVADKIHHQEPYSFSDFFGAFAHWKQIFYYQLMNMAIMLITMAPAIAIMAIYIYIPMFKGEIGDPDDIREMMTYMPLVYLFMIPAYYFIISYSFAPFLIIFGKLTYWDAMETSRKIIGKKFFWFLLFYIIMMAVVYVGVFAFFIGILFSIPVALCMMYAAYNDIMGKNTSSIDSKIDEIGGNGGTTAYNWQN